MSTDVVETIAAAYRWQRRLGNREIATAHCHIVVDPVRPDVWDANHADFVYGTWLSRAAEAAAR